ncbi:hypothetical protein EVA_02749 [gut metagenome]|uniref:Uncharacterized protein n=1 Tax=gut metagenome TaxID=749906 RepID=J9GME0_9ZZZZ
MAEPPLWSVFLHQGRGARHRSLCPRTPYRNRTGNRHARPFLCGHGSLSRI